MTTHDHCQCDFCSGVDCGADDPDRQREEEQKQKVEARNEVLDTVYKRLQSCKTTIWQSPQSFGQKFIVEWSDIDSLFAELKGEP